MSHEPLPFDPEVDNEGVYDREISPLMTQIIAICKQHNIPFVASFEFAEGSTCDSHLLPEGCDERLVKAKNIIRSRPQLMAFTITTIGPKVE